MQRPHYVAHLTMSLQKELYKIKAKHPMQYVAGQKKSKNKCIDQAFII